MQLRDHPQMFFHGFRNWPPVWVRLMDVETNNWRRLQGEIGILKEALYQRGEPNWIFLVIEHDDAEYIGSLGFDNDHFCLQIVAHFERFYGVSISIIGGSEIIAPLKLH